MRRYISEDIIHKLREADVLLGQGQTISQAYKPIGVSDHTYFCGRKQYGRLKIDQTKRLEELENARLKRVVTSPDSLAQLESHFTPRGAAASGQVREAVA